MVCGKAASVESRAMSNDSVKYSQLLRIDAVFELKQDGQQNPLVTQKAKICQFESVKMCQGVKVGFAPSTFLLLSFSVFRKAPEDPCPSASTGKVNERDSSRPLLRRSKPRRPHGCQHPLCEPRHAEDCLRKPFAAGPHPVYPTTSSSPVWNSSMEDSC